MNKKTIFGLVLMAAFTSLLFLSFGDQVQGYMDFQQAATTGSRAHVVGTWMKDQAMTYDRESNVFSFYMADQKGEVRQVVYANPKPANFEDAEQVVIEGSMNGDVFVAEYILVKCPSKYNETQHPDSIPVSS